MNRSINTIRVLAAEAVEKANSGHPGLPLGAATMAFVLWDKVMKHSPKSPTWFDRDRFVLSAGHGSALIYSLLHLYDYGLSMEDLKSFRQLNSKTPGHPEYGHTIGVETTTGPLGQGFANAVGMAMAERYIAAAFNKPNFDLIDHYTYTIVGDGCLMEGISYEAASLAGKLQLNKLIALYDSNKITIEGSTDLAFTENVKERFKAMHWEVLEVEDGNDEKTIEEMLRLAKLSKQPSLIIVKTVIGYGAPGKAGSHDVHGSPLGKETIDAMKKNFGWPEDDFFVPDDVKQHYVSSRNRLNIYVDEWEELFKSYSEIYPEDASKMKDWISGKLNLLDLDQLKTTEKTTATRSASGDAINAISKLNENFIGGSADLAPSNKTNINGGGSFGFETPLGKNIHFGVREHAMGAILNGLTLHGGLKVFGGTFLVFSDYMKPTIRLAALMNINTTFVFTHDSIGVGEDGPTHQPIEHLTMLRSIPNMTVYRPADYFETLVCWQSALLNQGPAAIIATRQNLKIINSSTEALKGGYIVKPESNQLDGILIATGSEVNLALEAAEALKAENIDIRVVSMPSLEIFEKQSKAYQDEILPKAKTIAIEAGSPYMWYKYTPYVVGMTSFGASAPAEELFESFNFTKEHIVNLFKSI
ncbi:MAG: transketolase [Clostridia bacterium]|nr:transketolase [Clostridia bacterium]